MESIITSYLQAHCGEWSGLAVAAVLSFIGGHASGWIRQQPAFMQKDKAKKK